MLKPFPKVHQRTTSTAPLVQVRWQGRQKGDRKGRMGWWWDGGGQKVAVIGQEEGGSALGRGTVWWLPFQTQHKPFWHCRAGREKGKNWALSILGEILGSAWASDGLPINLDWFILYQATLFLILGKQIILGRSNLSLRQEVYQARYLSTICFYSTGYISLF